MRAKVTEEGVTVPKNLLEGVEEVEIRKENGRIMIVPTTPNDPIFEFGKHPVVCGVPDASEHHDTYLYRSDS